MHCLVLGGNGFIGSHLVDHLLLAGHSVRVLDRNLRNLAGRDQRCEFVLGDIADGKKLDVALDSIEVVYYLAWTTIPQTSNADIVGDIQSNLVSSVGVLDRCVRAGVTKVVFASTGGAIYGIPLRVPIAEDHPTLPLSSYGITKLAVEKYARMYHHLHGLEVVVLRVSNAYGPRQDPSRGLGAATTFLSRAARGEEITVWGDGSIVRDYIHVEDVAEAYLCAGEQSCPSLIYNVGAGVGTSLNELLDIIRSVTGLPLRVRYTASRQFDVPAVILDSSLIETELKWATQIELVEGVRRTWDWIRHTAASPLESANLFP
ncbi:MAG: NAD-dependent epimerase/dehydratase family protein [Candidatus Binatia bacterium]